MSRIGQAPIAVPSGVDVTIDGRVVTVKGPKGTLSRTVPATISVQQVDGAAAAWPGPTTSATTAPSTASPAASSTTWSSASPTASASSSRSSASATAPRPRASDGIRLALGFSHPVIVKAPEGITFEVPVPTQIVVSGIDKEVVGQVAADIRSIRKPEPYKGKGVRYAGERVLRKAGKAGKK